MCAEQLDKQLVERKHRDHSHKGGPQHHRRQVKGLTCPWGRESFFQEGREGRKFG